MSVRAELEAELKEIVGKGLRQDASCPIVAPRTAEQVMHVVRAANDHHFNILVLGNESSQSPHYSALRENTLVILNVWLTGIEKLSPFAVKVLSGTPVSTVVHGGSEPPRKTIGGLICGTTGPDSDASLSALWPRVRSLEVITGAGENLTFAAPSAVSMEDPATANLFLGSQGRMGIVTSVELTTPLPIVVETSGSRAMPNTTDHGAPLLSRGDVRMLLDPNGLFQW